MAQIGRIGGPLLEENLLRNGVDIAFRNNTSTTQLLYIDVNNRRIGVNLNNPSYELEIFGTSATTNFISDELVLPSLRIEDNEINATVGDINLNAPEAIVLSNLETTDFFVSDNTIASKNNADIELRPNGTGILEVINDLRVYGNLHSTGNITLDGTITFGDTLVQDTVTFNADINSNIVPTDTDTYNLGSATKRWDNLYSPLINGEEITTGGATVGGIDLVKRQEYALYVATNGDDSNVGDHIQGPLASIQAAIAKIPTGTTDFYTIYVFPGTYQEQLPLVLPANVTVAGNDIRNTIVVPAAGYEDSDVFHLNGQTTVQNLTVKNFYYDSVNNTGYAFRFAPNGAITSRSPYVQNVSVITQGSITNVDDPRGFNAGDAGRGAYIDGAELNSSSFDASMLFHSVTMITPGVDAVTMTNGVRVEWLNSFTYFANRGLYAVNGATGRISQDGSTVNYGAEIRSIGSANVYGNFGAVADGNNTLMYLISHNFAYIGNGKDVSNDRTLAVQSQETVETNSGRIYYSSTDHTGTFRVGDNFFVDFDKGTTSVDISTLTTNSLSGLVINTGAATTTITGSNLETGNIRIDGNLIQSLTGGLNLQGASGTVNLLDSTAIFGNLDIVGNFNYNGSLSIKGDEVTDSLTFNVLFDQDFNPNETLKFSLGTPSKQWLIAHLNRLEVGNLSIYDNVIETNVTNADLELRANGSGSVYIPNSATFSNALDVNGTATLDNTIVQGSFNLNGNLNHTGNTVVSDDVDITQNLTVGLAAQFEEILVDGNTITTTSSNADLELKAAGAGTVNIQTSATLGQNLYVNNIQAQDNVTVAQTLTTDTARIASVEINDNYIQPVVADQSLTLLASGNISVPDNNVSIVQNLTVNGATYTQASTVTGLLSHAGNRIQTGTYSIAGEFTNGNILIEDNFITTTISNSDLELLASGTGVVLISTNNVIVTNNLTVNGNTNLQSIEIDGTLTHTGIRIQTGNYTQTGNLLVDGSIDIDSDAQFTDILISGNTVTTTENNSNLVLIADETETVNVDGSLVINNNLLVNSITVQGDIEIDQDLELEKISIPPSIIGIRNNYITTKDSNSDLELRANGSGSILVESNNVLIENNLTVLGNTSLQDVDITGTVLHTGDRVQTGDYTQLGNLTVVGAVTISNTAQLDDVKIDQNTVQSTNGNLILEASNLGIVTFSNLTVEQNLSARTLNAGNITINDTLALEVLESSTDIQIFDNVITTTNSNSNLELRANGSGSIWLQQLAFNTNTISTPNTNITFSPAENIEISATGAVVLPTGTTLQRTNITGDIRFNTTDNIFEAYGLSSTITFNGIYSSNRRTNVLAHPTNNTLLFTVNQTQVGSISANSLTLHALQVNDLFLNNNAITTNVSNSDLEFRMNGAGELVIDNLSIKDNLIKNNGTALVLASTGFGYTKLASVNGAVFPSGTVAERPAPETPPQTGDTRFNTDDNVLEVWDGSTYIVAAGTSSTISESEFNDLVLEYTLILG
jgi:hypothetical protein